MLENVPKSKAIFRKEACFSENDFCAEIASYRLLFAVSQFSYTIQKHFRTKVIRKKCTVSMMLSVKFYLGKCCGFLHDWQQFYDNFISTFLLIQKKN